MGSRRASNAAGGSTGQSSRPSLAASWPFPRPLRRPWRRSYWRRVGVLGEQTAVWLALGIGVVTLGVQGRRYAAVEQLDRTGTLTAVALNVLLGLVIVGLKALLAH